jgi:hypothetical protein
MNIGDRVLIGGRTMLRPGFSLVGLEAVVMPTFPNAPEGCATVKIDWEGAGYDLAEYDDLPPFINVPIVHLDPVAVTGEAEPSAPALGLVAERVLDDAPTKPSKPSATPDEAPPTDAPQDDMEKPRLRLI